MFLPGESQGRGAWWAAVYGVAQSRTRLKRLSSSKGNGGTQTNDRPSAVNTLSIMLEMLPERANIAIQSLSDVWSFVTPWTAVHQASLSFTISWSLLTLMSIELVMPSNPFILCPKSLFRFFYSCYGKTQTNFLPTQYYMKRVYLKGTGRVADTGVAAHFPPSRLRHSVFQMLKSTTMQA